jgi:acyl-homoserine-lactone acylase
LTGNTSANNWDTKNMYPLDKMIQLKNPNCGYLYNCNNTPLKMTAPEENIKLEDYPKSFGIPTSNTIRANSFMNMIKTYDEISFEEVRKIRESVTIDKNKMSFRNCMNCNDIPKILSKHPELSAVKKVFDKWNGAFTIDNKQASIISLSIKNIAVYVVDNFGNVEQDVPEEVMIEAFLKAGKFMMKHYGTLEVELGKIQKAVRYGVEFPMYGNISTLAAAQFKTYKKNKLELKGGDSFIMYAKYGKDGLESMETINAFGNSNKKGHPHSTDQTEMYVNMQTKTVELDVVKIKAIGKTYHPE